MTAAGPSPTDPRVRAVLEGPGPWRRLEHHREVGSTNEVAAGRADAGLVVVADHQTAGRGRLDRRWEDRGRQDPGASLLVSFLVSAPSRGLELVPLAVGLAVRDALRTCGAEPALEWPNDVLVPDRGRHRKCGGVLVEHRSGARLVVGVGVDVDWRGLDRSGEAAAWASVAESTGQPVDRWEVLAALMEALAARLKQLGTDPGGVRGAYVQACVTLGRDVAVETGGRRITGRAAGITPRGALVVETSGGPVPVTVGDVREVGDPA